MGTLVLLDLMGGVALLLWGLHMVRTGILRAYGADLRRVLSKAVGNRLLAVAAGLGGAASEQHGDGAHASFTAEGLIGLVGSGLL
jgi:phosphate:Na+ symporter